MFQGQEKFTVSSLRRLATSVFRLLTFVAVATFFFNAFSAAALSTARCFAVGIRARGGSWLIEVKGCVFVLMDDANGKWSSHAYIFVAVRRGHSISRDRNGLVQPGQALVCQSAALS
jgi:hypothetical protein